MNEPRIDRRAEAAFLAIMWSLYGIAKCSAAKVRAQRRWWGFGG